MHNGIGAPNGPRSQPFDRWFRYPAGFSVNALNACFNAIASTPDDLIMDPFAGAGTTATHAVEKGLGFIGIETHPLIAELVVLKSMRPASPQSLIDRAIALTEAVAPAPIANEPPLVVQSFDSDTLALLVGLRDAIRGLDGDPWQGHLKWCLLGTLRDCASAKVGWPYQRPTMARIPRIADPRRAFVRRARWMVEDLLGGPLTPQISIIQGDARADCSWVEALGIRTADAVVTSPPYLNNFDYADATRLEVYFWGIARSWKELTTVVRSGMVTATTQQSRKGAAEVAADAFGALCPRTARIVGTLRDCLRRERANRPRGKEYDQVLPAYFYDLARVFINVRQHTSRYAPVVLVLGDSAPYGIHIDTPSLLASVAEEIGFTHKVTRPLRHRGLRWHTNGTRHTVALNEQLVLLRSPGAF